MRIQYFSDVHLEFGPQEPAFSADADLIVAAGDIGVGLQGIDWLASAPCPVVYVAGNHEFYGQCLTQLPLMLCERATKHPQLHFLERGSWQSGSTRIFGLTLWSAWEGVGVDRIDEYVELINDFWQIEFAAGRPLHPADTLTLHRESLRWLDDALSRPWSGRTIVVSHHAPSLQSWPAEADASLRPAYCSSLEPLMRRHAIDLWFHGHVHSPSDYRVAGTRTRVLCNPRGYHGLREVAGFSLARTVDLG